MSPPRPPYQTCHHLQGRTMALFQFLSFLRLQVCWLGCPKVLLFSKPRSPGPSCHPPLLLFPEPTPCLMPEVTERAGRQQRHTQPSLPNNTESADCSWHKGTFSVVGTRAFPLTPTFACSHCIRVREAVACVVVESFSLLLLFFTSFKR